MRKVRKGNVRNGSRSAVSKVLSAPILLAAILAGLLVFGTNTFDPIGFTTPDSRNGILAGPAGELDGVPQLGEGPMPSGSSNLVILVTDAPIDDFESFYVTFTLVEVLKSSKPVYQEIAVVEGVEGEGEVADPEGGEGVGEAVADPEPDPVVEVEAEVEVDEGENWMTVMEGSQTIDLLALSASENKPQTTEMLGVSSLDPGKYTQVRITVESAEGMLNDGAMMMPITINEGVFKIVKPFEILPDSTTYITIDFTLGNGVIKTGQGEYKTIPPRMIGPVIVEYREDDGDAEPLVEGEGAVGEDVANPILVGDADPDEKAGKPENPGKPANPGKPEESDEPREEEPEEPIEHEAPSP